MAKSLCGWYRWERVARCPLCGGDQFAQRTPSRYGVLRIGLQSCVECGLMLQSPRLTARSLARYYRSDYQWHQSEENGGRRAIAQFARGQRRGTYIMEFLRRSGAWRAGQFVVEVGCSYGGVLEALRQAGCRVQGSELDPAAVAFARSQGLEVFAGSWDALERLPQPPEGIILSHVVEHVPDPLSLLACARQALAPGGWLYIEVPGMENARVLKRRWAQPAHLAYFTRATLQRLAQMSGFSLESANDVIQGVFRIEHAAALVGAATTGATHGE